MKNIMIEILEKKIQRLIDEINEANRKIANVDNYSSYRYLHDDIVFRTRLLKITECRLKELYKDI